MIKLLMCVTALVLLTCQMSETRRACIPSGKVCGKSGRLQCCAPLQCMPVVNVDSSQVTALHICLPSPNGGAAATNNNNDNNNNNKNNNDDAANTDVAPATSVIDDTSSADGNDSAGDTDNAADTENDGGTQ